MKFLTVLILVVFGSLKVRAASVDTARFHYPIGAYDLSLKYKKVLVSIGNRLKTGDSVYVTGFADYLGKPESNMKLSLKRAATVKAYLASLNKNLVITISGKGEIPAGLSAKSSLGNYKDRRVDLIIGLRDSMSLNSISKPKEPVVDKSPPEKLSNLALLKPGDFFSLNDLNFLPGKHFPTSRSMYYLENLLRYLKAHPSMEFQIQGHVCCTTGGGDAYDIDTQKWELSVTRAQYVYEFFLKRGIAAARMSIKGFGSDRPKVRPEITNNDRDLNRRVEFMILKQ